MKNKTITYLKFIATLIVFVRHAFIVSLDANWGVQLSSPIQAFFVPPAWTAVWMFFLISGFLTGRTLLIKKKYSLDFSGGFSFIVDRIITILVPTYCFIFIAQLLVSPQYFANMKVWIRFLTCTFNGGSAGRGIGATWYVFVLMWLYVLAIPVSIWLERTQFKSSTYNRMIAVLLLFGMVYRLAAKVVLDLDWYNWCYANPLANIDLFFGGYLLNKVSIPEKATNSMKSWIAFFFVIVTNCFASYYMELEVSLMGRLYRYIYPTAIYIVSAQLIMNSLRNKDSGRIPSPIIIFEKSQFNFYLWHTVVLYKISEKITVTNPWGAHLLLLVTGFCVTWIVAWIFTLADTGLIEAINARRKNCIAVLSK